MKKTLVITDVTQMPAPDEVCVVGIDTEGRCIRPICEGGFSKQYLYDIKHRVILRHGARVEFDLYPVDIRPPHIEDMRFEPASIVGKGLCSVSEWEHALKITSYKIVEDIFSGYLKERGWVMPGSQTRSIATLSGARIIDVELTSNSVKPRIIFTDSSGYEFNRPASDLNLWERCFSLVKRQGRNLLEVKKELLSILKDVDRLYLRLGLARPWDQDQKCWLQITGVYTFPDYLKGKCFADFKP